MKSLLLLTTTLIIIANVLAEDINYPLTLDILVLNKRALVSKPMVKPSTQRP